MEKIKLKKLTDISNKKNISFIYAFIFIIIYSISGSFQIGNIRYLPIDDFEMNIPFMVESIWVYILLYPLLIGSIYSYKKNSNFNKVLYAFIIVAAVSFMFFQILPVAYPREFFPLPRYDAPSVNMFFKIRFYDTSLNCFPSLHVSLSFIFSFFHWDESKKLFWGSSILSIFIAISTLTTKQHYIADIVSGFILALVVFLLVRNCTEITQSHE
jgi:membrane-associated phospholipid phosphatase